MRASGFELQDHDGWCELRARVESPALGAPFDLWFRFPAALEAALDPARGDPLVAALLLPAMKVGEPLEIDAPVSPRLRRATRRIQEMYRVIEPRLEVVAVEAPEPNEPAVPGDRVGLFYSGGVDSSYSLTKNAIPHPLNEDTIDALIVLNGIDLRIGDPRTHLFERMRENTRRVAERLGRQMFDAATNVQDLMEQMGVSWGNLGHGAGLACVGLALARRYRRLYIAPAGGSWRRLVPSASHPLLDPLWSTETLEFVHDGCEATRLERIQLLADHPLVIDALHVCWDRESLDFNCGRCSKCLLLQVGLHAAGAAGRCPTLPPAIDLDALRGLNLVIRSEVEWCREFAEALDAPADAPLREALIELRDRFRGYFDRLQRAARTLRRLAPGRTPFVLVDEEDIREKLGVGIPFLERDGVFAGNPPDDEVAIRELERLRAAGAQLVSIWCGAFWYLDHYRGFHRHLREHYRCVAEDESLIAFDLRRA